MCGKNDNWYMLLAFQGLSALVFLRDLGRFRGTTGAIGKFSCPMTIYRVAQFR